MSMTIILYIGKAAASALVEAGLKKVMAIDVNGAQLGARAEQMVLAIFTGASMNPEPTFEQKASQRFHELEGQISGLRKDVTALQRDMAEFKWQVKSLLYQAREEDLWQTMLQIENSCDSHYNRLKALGESTDTIEARKQRSLQIADQIIDGNVGENIANAKLAFLGDRVGTGRERVRGFLEIWREQVLREADLGWRGERLWEIYDLLEAKFTRALLIQAKCGRLMMEAHQARHTQNSSHKSAIDYFVDTFYPILSAEVIAFRDAVESVAVNIIPLPDRAMGTITIPDEISAVLAAVDVYVAQALNGKISNSGSAPGGRTIAGLPALSGCWGRVLVPGTRWIRRAPGTTERASATITAGNKTVTCKGRLEVRSIAYTPYEGLSGKKLHEGYQLMVNNAPRDMDKMLLAQFVPEEVLSPELEGTLDLRLEDANREVLAQTKTIVVPIPIDETKKKTVPYGTFTMAFTGGADVRGR